MPVLTVSGNEITDATRLAATQGDGRIAPDSSFGIWEATTNLVTNGGAESNTSGWSIGNNDWSTNVGGVLSRDTSAFKFGTASFKVAPDDLAGNEGIRRGLGASSSGTVYTASFWHNAPAGVTVGISLGENAQNKLNKATQAGNGTWQRITVTWTGTGNSMFVWASVVTQTATPVNFDGIQVEQKAYATPYVETNGSTATRSAADVQAPASLLSSVQGWFALREVMEFPSASMVNGAAVGFVWGLSPTNAYKFSFANSTKKWAFARYVGGVTTDTVAAATTDSFTAGDPRTIVVAWTATQIGISVNGGAFVWKTITLGALDLSAYTVFHIGTDPAATQQTNSNVKWAACGTGTLTDADTATLDGYGDAGPTYSQLQALNAKAAAPTMMWGADTIYYDPNLAPAASATMAATAPASAISLVAPAAGASMVAYQPVADVSSTPTPGVAELDADAPVADVTWPPVLTPLPASAEFRMLSPLRAKSTSPATASITRRGRLVADVEERP